FDENDIPIVEPRQIPPLVSQHLPWLRPTARNKMWNAVIDSKATAGGFQDRYGLPPRGAVENRQSLLEVGVPLLAAANSPETLGNVRAKVGTLDATSFLTMFSKFAWHPQYEDEVIAPFRKFLEKATNDGRIKDWAVVWPQPKQAIGHLK